MALRPKSQADAKAKLKPGYETTVVTRTELSESALKTLKGKVEKIIKKHDGQILNEEDWGKRRLAQPVKKETRGQYNFVCYTAKPGVINELESQLRIQENVLSFLSVKLKDEFDPENDLEKPSVMLRPKENRNTEDFRFS